MHERLTYFGLAAVTASAISCPIRNASGFERPRSRTNRLSVSPYTTFAFQSVRDSTIFTAASNVHRPLYRKQ